MKSTVPEIVAETRDEPAPAVEPVVIPPVVEEREAQVVLAASATEPPPRYESRKVFNWLYYYSILILN